MKKDVYSNAESESPMSLTLQGDSDDVGADQLPSKQVLPGTLITRFLSGWLFSLILLAVLAFSVDIDWAKPFLQQGLSLLTRRDVHLGHLTWSWRPGNLTIVTTKILVTAPDGAKLLSAGPSEVGLAFFPLLKKRGSVTLLGSNPSFLYSYLMCLKVEVICISGTTRMKRGIA